MVNFLALAQICKQESV